MWATEDYHLDFSAKPEWIVADAEKILGLVWRFDFTAPGFCLLDLGQALDSHALRSRMLALEEQLSEISLRMTGKRFAYRSVGRFDQQETTKFHLDGAPAESMLLLGYEPSRVRSRLFLADYSRCSFDLGIEPQQFLQSHNPMYKTGESLLERYVTELPQADERHARLLLLNNSFLPFVEARTNSLGVLHKAEIVNPSESERRVVNSVLLALGDTEAIGRERQDDFVKTEVISPRIY
jgi:hypothetical protein